MPTLTNQITVALEIGNKRVFASALEWPGWARSGRNEVAALQSLFDYGPRYQQVIRSARLGFRPPTASSPFTVVERLAGDATTDFGAPGVPPPFDSQPVDATTLRRLKSLLGACWKTFAATVETAHGKPLRKGPRGGGRETAAIVAHVLDSHSSYLSSLGARAVRDPATDSATAIHAMMLASQDALTLAAAGKIPERGPRGGVRWSPRYFVRRAAWHILDHVWEIEDRMK
jgi:hypothetical protein